MTFLEIGIEIADRIGLPRPTSLYNSSDQTARFLASLIHQEALDMLGRHAWQAVTKEKTFTSIAAEAQTGVVPADFSRIIDGTFWNRSENRMVLGPASPHEWQGLKSDRIQALHDIYRQRGNTIYLLPTPVAGQTYAFEYVSTYWVAAAADTTTGVRSEIADDTDEPLLDDELLVLGGAWRFLRSKGLDYSEPFRSYELRLSRLIGHDGGAVTLSMNGPSDKFTPPKAIIPDGSWNLS